MHVLIAIALKSVLISGLTLGLLALMTKRSAAERSWVAHIGLLALVIIAFAPLVMPTWTVEAPALLGHVDSIASAPVTTVPADIAASASQVPLAHPVQPVQASAPSPSATAIATAGYAIPAAILLFITALALARLIALRARADVLVDGHWLSALARAQRRMGFKHGTALLTSNELASPISWGLMRPVILLNSRAVEASNEAEAILAHELAHVARMDWVKLLLARVATALFWFNPLVWLLAREAHQLREETADDAVLAADITDTDYAELLVGVARHECPGLLLGAHGVAPSRGSLARRVARVLDGKSVRGPVAGGFAFGVFTGAVLVAAPLAALNIAPGGASAASRNASTPLAANATLPPYYPSTHDVPADLPHIIAKGVSTSVASAVAAIGPGSQDIVTTAPSGASAIVSNGTTIARAPSGATVTLYPAGPNGLARIVARAANGATAEAMADPGDMDDYYSADPRGERRQRSAIDRAIEIKSLGVTPEYVASMRAAAPQIQLSQDEIVELAAVGVTPGFIQQLAAAGYRNLSADQISGAYAVGVRSDYIRGMAAVGYARIPLHDLIKMRAVGVMPSDVERFRRAGYDHVSVEELVQAKTLGITPEELKASERDDP